MKKIVSEQKNCFIALAISIVLCEILLELDNRFFQTVGICLLPVIVWLVVLLIKNDNKKTIKG